MKIKIIIFLSCLLVAGGGAIAQGSQMLIEQIQGKTVTRKDFNSSDKFEGKQEFLAGKITQSGNILRIIIQTKFYDETNKLTSSYTTTYRCEPEQSNVLLSVFTVNPRNQKIKVSVTQGILKICMD